MKVKGKSFSWIPSSEIQKKSKANEMAPALIIKTGSSITKKDKVQIIGIIIPKRKNHFSRSLSTSNFNHPSREKASANILVEETDATKSVENNVIKQEGNFRTTPGGRDGRQVAPPEEATIARADERTRGMGTRMARAARRAGEGNYL